MNDHHSHLSPERFQVSAVDLPFGGDGEEKIGVRYGGFPNLASLSNSLSTNATLKLHAGDMITGTLFYSLYKGDADAAAMDMICFDVATIGNHEFDEGDETLAIFLGQLHNHSGTCNNPTDVVSANIEPAQGSALDGLIKDYVIKEVDGEKIAIIGVTTTETALSSSPNPTTNFEDAATMVTAAAVEVTNLGVNKVVVLSHVGYEEDLHSLAEIPGVDVVVGGHSHSLLYPDGANEDTMERLLRQRDGPYPSLVRRDASKDAGLACVVTAWEYGHGLGMLDVGFDDEGNVLTCEGGTKFPFDASPNAFEPQLDEANALALSSYLEDLGPFMAVVPDQSTTDELAVFEEGVENFGSEVIAAVPEPGICLERVPGIGRSLICSKENTLQQGGGVCNLVSQAFLDLVPTADVTILNAGMCRIDIFPGNFTVNDANLLLPFSHTLVTFPMTGADIVTVLNQAVGTAMSGISGAYPYAAGLRYNVNEAAPNHVSNVEVNVRLSESSWSPLNLDATYTVGTDDFLALGRDGYEQFGEIDDDLKTNTYKHTAVTFIKYARKVRTLMDPKRETYSTKSFTGSNADVIGNTEAAPDDPESSLPRTQGPTGAPIMGKASASVSLKASQGPITAILFMTVPVVYLFC
ncbi:hypothetical protein ACHAWF_002690 [Thalassiosira exigua]